MILSSFSMLMRLYREKVFKAKCAKVIMWRSLNCNISSSYNMMVDKKKKRKTFDPLVQFNSDSGTSYAAKLHMASSTLTICLQANTQYRE